MSRYDFAFLACRILALWVFVDVLITVPQYASQAIYYAAEHDLGTAAIMACGPGVQLVLVSLIWFFAPVICVRLLPPGEDTAPVMRVNANALLGVAVAAIGVLFISTALMWLVTEVYAWRFDHGSYPGWKRGRADIVQAVIELVIGVVMIAQARRIVVWICGFQRFARKGSISND